MNRNAAPAARVTGLRRRRARSTERGYWRLFVTGFGRVAVNRAWRRSMFWGLRRRSVMVTDAHGLTINPRHPQPETSHDDTAREHLSRVMLHWAGGLTLPALIERAGHLDTSDQLGALTPTPDEDRPPHPTLLADVRASIAAPRPGPLPAVAVAA